MRDMLEILSNTTTYLQENATDTYWWSLSPGGFRW